MTDARDRQDSVTIGTRGSMLAVTQTGHVADALRRHYPDLRVTVTKYRTRGDDTQGRDRPIGSVGTKGLFTAELEEALASGEIDLAVHSAKDVPGALADGTDMLAWPQRADPRDALIAGPDALSPARLADLPAGAVVGSSSMRRAGQLLALRPDLVVEPIRGNIETRIRKVREGQFAATLLAAAGLSRAGMLDEAAELFAVDRIVPAGGQGVLALQGRADDEDTRRLLSVLDHAPTRGAVAIEREVIRLLAGGCNMPLGVFAEPAPGQAEALSFNAIAVLCDPSGSPRIEARATGSDAAAVAGELVETLKTQGGDKLLGTA